MSAAGLAGGTQDFPLTLTHLLGRARGINGEAAVVTQLDAEGRLERSTLASVGARAEALAAGLAGLGLGAGRPGRRLLLEQPPPPRGLLGRALRRARPAHDEPAALARADRLHRAPLRRPGDRLRRGAAGGARTGAGAARGGRAGASCRLRGRGRRRAQRRRGDAFQGGGGLCRERERWCHEPAGGVPRRPRLRGAARRGRGGDRRRRIRAPGPRRARRRGPLLHLGDDRRPEGRPLLAPLPRPAHDPDGGDRDLPDRRPRPGPRRRPDVPRDGLEPRLPRPAWSAPTSSCPAASCSPSR